MDDRLTRIEEQIALMQAHLSPISDELYAQQKENGSLRREIETLKDRTQSVQSGGGILRPEEDSPPRGVFLPLFPVTAMRACR